jgi:pimeloyl-ACP methyl ester carboxylesterase
MSAIIVKEEILHYEVLGRGKPVVFLHDWVGSWRYWISSMQAASLSYRTYALDLWGFGDTARNPDRYNLEQQVDLLDEFMEELGINRAVFIGHGFGAILSILFALHHESCVDRIVGISLPMNEATIHPRMRTNAPTELADWLMGRNSSHEAAWAEAVKADPRAISISMTGLPNIELGSLATRLQAPLLLVHGQNDPAIGLPDANLLAGLPENTHWILFEQSGHYPMLDENSKFNRLLSDFLYLPSGESPRRLQLKEEWKRRVR